MDVSLLPNLQGILECFSLVFIGHQLRQNGLFRPNDGQVAMRVASFTTLPSIALQSFCSYGPINGACWVAVASGCLCMAAQTFSSWCYPLGKGKRERAVLSGTSIGSNIHSTALPLVSSLFPHQFTLFSSSSSPLALPLTTISSSVPVGIIAMQAILLLDLFNQAFVHLASYLAFGSSGPASPSSYQHEDGGTYRGQWRGMKKEGLGVYLYPSGARYEGEWRDNVKDGRGVYFFTKGGTYEGEWSGGIMNGLGIRTYSTGQVKAGRWVNGEMKGPTLEIWQVSNAAEGAAEASVAARKVPLGGGSMMEGLEGLLSSPVMWVCLAGLALNLTSTPLPASIDMATRALAPANKPLTLIALGISLSSILGLKQPSTAAVTTNSSNSSSATSSTSALPFHDFDSHMILSRRVFIPAVIGFMSFLAQGVFLNSNSNLDPTTYLPPMAAVTLALISPLSTTATFFCQLFRLNEKKCTSLLSLSYILSLPTMVSFGLIASNLILNPLPTSSVALLPTFFRVFNVNAAAMGISCLAIFSALALLLAFKAPMVQTTASTNALDYHDRPLIKMVYAPNGKRVMSDDDIVSSSGQGGGEDGGQKGGIIRPRKKSPPPSALPSRSGHHFLNGARQIIAARGRLSCSFTARRAMKV